MDEVFFTLQQLLSRGKELPVSVGKRLAERGAECQHTYIEMQITGGFFFASSLKPYVECEVSLLAVTRNYSSVSGLNFYYRIIHPYLN